VGGLGPSLIMGSGGFRNEGRGAEPVGLGDGRTATWAIWLLPRDASRTAVIMGDARVMFVY